MEASKAEFFDSCALTLLGPARPLKGYLDQEIVAEAQKRLETDERLTPSMPDESLLSLQPNGAASYSQLGWWGVGVTLNKKTLGP